MKNLVKSCLHPFGYWYFSVLPSRKLQVRFCAPPCSEFDGVKNVYIGTLMMIPLHCNPYPTLLPKVKTLQAQSYSHEKPFWKVLSQFQKSSLSISQVNKVCLFKLWNTYFSSWIFFKYSHAAPTLKHTADGK